MPRKRVISKKDTYQKVQDALEKERPQDDIDIMTGTELVARAGGSINNLPVKTKAFKGWLEAHQSTNPFIGKHVTAAPEYFTEEKKLNEVVVDIGDVELDINGVRVDPLGSSVTPYNPDDDSGPKVEDLGPAIKGDDKHDFKFIDITIIENTTKKLLSSETEDIIKTAETELKNYHNDDKYSTEMNIEKIVDEHKIMLISNQTEKQKLIK